MNELAQRSIAVVRLMIGIHFGWWAATVYLLVSQRRTKRLSLKPSGKSEAGGVAYQYCYYHR